MMDQALLYQALLKYCEWLNHWTHSDPWEDPHTYAPEQFKVEYGTHVRALIPTGSSSAFPRILMEARVYDGDDGGATDLTVWFEATEEGVYRVLAMVQGFDTNLQFIVEEGMFKNFPEEKTP